jgi:HPt (histidine-containing phosphotransfer) domain-containing protein
MTERNNCPFYLRPDCIKILPVPKIIRRKPMASDTGKAQRFLDRTIASAHVDGDMQLLAELAAMFLQDYPRLIEEIRSSIRTQNASDLERAAHTLKGRLAFFGVEKARMLALELETMGRSEDLAGAPQALHGFETVMTAVLPEFDSLAGENEL